MTVVSDPEEFRDLEEAARLLATRVRGLSGAVRALAVLGEEIAGLQAALAGLSPADGGERWSGTVAGGSAGRGEEATPQDRDLGPASVGFPLPVTNGAYPASTNGADPSDGTGPDRHEAEQAHESTEAPPVVVSVSTQCGSVDLIRLYRALQRLPQVGGLTLTSYNGGKAVLGMTTPARPHDLPIEPALHDAFPEGIIGGWTGEREFVAVITASG